MKFYVASKFEHASAVSRAIAELTVAGHAVTLDWTKHEQFDWNKPREAERLAWKYSYLDVEGVRSADVFIMLTYNGLSMRGAYVELGVALGLGKLVYIVGAAFYRGRVHWLTTWKPVMGLSRPNFRVPWQRCLLSIGMHRCRTRRGLG